MPRKLTGLLTRRRAARAAASVAARLVTLAVALLAACAAGAEDGAWSGNVAGELQLFPQNPADDHQHRHGLSLSLSPRYYREWPDRGQSFSFEPFLRLDPRDAERTHADIRELYWEKVADTWELRLGINKVFWGVTESQHLVDIINQTDFVEDVAGEEKLGQPMLNLALIRNWGTIDLFILPGFRERTFPSREGRLRPPLPVDEADYESGAGKGHVDWAVRWSRSAGSWDIGIAHFQGTAREPRFRPRLDGWSGLKLAPYYEQIRQTSLDLQYTTGAWLWKLEAIVRNDRIDTFTAFTGGFEYTFYGVFGTALDVGLLAEYLYDSRGRNDQSPFENDLFLGTRIGWNDKQNTQLLLGGIFDVESGAMFVGLEASRRLGQDWKLSVKGRLFAGFEPNDPAVAFEKDDHLKVELAWYF